MIVIRSIDPDLELPIQSAPDLEIGQRSAYPRAYHQVAGAIHAGEDLTVIVRDRAAARWLRLMAERYGFQEIAFEEINPRSLLQSQLEFVELPEEIENQEILDSRLLELRIPSKENESFEHYILRIFFGDWLVSGNNLHQVGDFCASYEPDQWDDALRRPIVEKIYRQRLGELREINKEKSNPGNIELLDWLELSPDVLRAKLFAFRVLQKYPNELGNRIIGDRYSDLLELALDLRNIPLTFSDDNDLLHELSVYLRSILANEDPEEYRQLLDRVSGYLDIEFDVVHEVLASGLIEVTEAIVDSARRRFIGLSNSPRIDQGLDDLDLLVSRLPPEEPSEDWDEADWVRWAVNEYLPYRHWLENTGRITEKISEIAGLFSDWYFQNYGSLLYHSDRMVWKSLLRMQEQIKEHSSPVLIAIVDNFNTKFYDFFKGEMQRQGFFEQEMEYSFALIPTCTEVSKRSLLTAHHAPFKGTNYSSHVEKAWATRLNKKVKYLASLGELRGEAERTADVYFLNYLALDIALHQNSNQLGVSHAQTARTYLGLLTRDIASFSRRIGAGQDLMVIVVSDHGSTNIPKGAVNVIQEKFYRSRAEDEHHRYLSITDEESRKLPENSKYDCYFINKDNFELASNYLVARKLYRFLPTHDHAYIHGGLTPEEVLVPFAVYKPATVIPKKLDIRILNPLKVFIGTKFDLDLEITNTNNHTCEQVLIQVLSSDIQTDPISLDELGALSRQSVEAPARCQRTANPSEGTIKASIEFTFQGRSFEHTLSLPIEIVEPAKPKFDLDNL